MGFDSIKNKIENISDGGRNTAAEMRSVLTEMTQTLSASTAFSGTTDGLLEGSTNLYYTDGRVDSKLVGYSLTGHTHAEYALDSNFNTHSGDTNNPHSVTKTQLGLSNVDNTSDINKPISSATTVALDLKYEEGDNPIFNSIQLSGGSASEGILTWNAVEGTVDLTALGVTYQLGQEISPLVRNATGSLITNGTPVMFAGTLGASGRVLITPAIADGSIPSSYVLGVATEDISSGSDGHVTWFGKVRGINTSGSLYGETWNDSDILYVSPITAGYLTNIKPEANDEQIFIGVVVNANPSQGTIFIRPSWRGKLTDLSDVNGTPLSVTGQILVWDNARQLFDFTSNVTDFALDSNFNTHTGDTSIHFAQSAITITESQISDLQSYSLTGHTHNLDEITTFGNTTPNSIDVGGVISPSFQFEPLTGNTPAAIGEMRWNADDGTIDVGMIGGNVVLQVGQELHAYVKASGTITNGDVIYASGAVGASGKLLISKFIANNTIQDIRVLGIATEDILSGEFGYITVFGVVRGLKTNYTGTGTWGTTWVEGDILYASNVVAGGMTNIKPAKPLHGIRVAMVINVHASNGSVFVRPSIGEHLNDLHDVNLSALTNGDVIQYNSTTDVFENQQIQITESQISDLQSYSLTGHTHSEYLTGYTDSSGEIITGATFTGTITKTLTLRQRDGSTITAQFNDSSGGGGSGEEITGATFNPTSGDLNLTTNSGSTITTNIDGRYSLTGHTHADYALNSDLTSHTGDTTVHYVMSAITITESQISDLQSYSLTGHTHTTSQITDFSDSVTGNTTVVANTAKTGITETQSANIITNNAKTGITVSQSNAIIGNTSGLASHTGDTTIHFTKGSINLSELGSTGHTHTVSEITDFSNSVTGNTAVVANTAKITNAAHAGDVSGSTELTITPNAVTYSKLQQSSVGFTVLGKTATGAGNYAEIAAGTDGVLRRSGTGNLSFGSIVTNNITNSAVTLAKMANVATGTVFYRKTAATGVPEVQTLATLRTDLNIINDYVTGATFNTTNGNLTSTRLSGGTFVTNLDGRYSLTGHTHSDYTPNTTFNTHTGDTTIHYTKGSINLSDLGTTGHTHTVSNITDFPTNVSSFTNDAGYLTGATSTADDYVTSGAFDNGTGNLTLTRLSGGTVVTNLDNRYSLTGHTHSIYALDSEFTSHTGDTTIHYAKGSINLSDLGSSAHTHTTSLIIPCSDEISNITTGTTVMTFRMPHGMILSEVRASVNVAPSGSTIIVDINQSGTTIMTTNKLSIDANEKTSKTAAVAAGITTTTLNDDSEITIDIVQVGSAISGTGLKVTLIGLQI